MILNGEAFPQQGERIEDFAGIDHPDIHAMALEPAALVHLKTGERRSPETLNGKKVRGVAGIGNPSRFFDTLRQL
ncbi:tetraacyldisaccharide 4'-kinase, partial [Klebsiella variicola]